MKLLLKTLALMALIVAASGSSIAADRANADDAVAMVKKAVATIKSKGVEKAFSEFSDPANKDFHDRDLYVYVYDLNGVAVAHGNNPKMVGKNLSDIKDPDGVPILKALIDTVNSKGKGWVDYKWPNPVTKAIERKSAYVEKVDNLVVGSGIYKP